MKKLYVRTECDELELVGVEPKDIIEDMDFIIFGEEAKVAKERFISYQFVEVKE